jgi:hypothetical protein
MYCQGVPGDGNWCWESWETANPNPGWCRGDATVDNMMGTGDVGSDGDHNPCMIKMPAQPQPEAPVAVSTFKRTYCHKRRTYAERTWDLEMVVAAFTTAGGGGDFQELRCFMKKFPKEWPHTPGKDQNMKHRKPQIRFEISGGIVENTQERRMTPRGNFKNKCLKTDNTQMVLLDHASPTVAVPRGDSGFCNPCVDITMTQVTTGTTGEKQFQMDFECRVFYGDENKNKAEADKCTPQGFKCRKGTYTIDEGTDFERNLNRGGMRCAPPSYFGPAFQWIDDGSCNLP